MKATFHQTILASIAMFLAIGLSVSLPVHAQSPMDSIAGRINPLKWSHAIERKAEKIQQKLIARSQKTLDRLQRQEEKIYHKMLDSKDSLHAKAALAEIRLKYWTFREKLGNPSLTSTRSYLPKLDTLSTALKFFDHHGVGGNIKNALAQSGKLQDKFQQAEEIKRFIRERKEQLKEQLERSGFTRELKRFNKEVYYYSAQLNEYKELLKDSKKAERKVIEWLRNTRQFKDFMRRHSQLASLFRLPGNDPSGSASLAGLQTRSQVNGLIQQQISSGGPDAQQQLRQNLQQAQSQLTQLKNRLSLSGGNSSEDILPEGFKPNRQKTKSFWKRLEYGTNVQTQKSNGYWPVTSDIGLSLGYKVNDRSIIGIGGSYKLGWGSGIRNIQLSSEGTSVRSFIDWNLKKSFWVSGGFEMNYRSAFNSIAELRHLDAWHQSGLIGMSKVVSVRSKFLKKTKLQLLWDFLSYEQVPRAQPVVFRIGYTF